MKAMDILEAMTDISNAQIQSVQQMLEFNTKSKSVRRSLSLKKVFLLSAAILIFTAITFATAMAVSADFRSFIFDVFHIEQPHIIDDPILDKPLQPEDMYVEPSFTIDNRIKGLRIHTPVASHVENGTFLLCTDIVESRQGSSYDAYREDSGKLIKLDQNHFSHSYSLYGNDLTIEFDWAECNGLATVTSIDPNQPFFIPNHAGSAESSLVHFYLPSLSGWYPVLLNFRTGEITDILSGTGVNQLSCIEKAAISPDHTKLLLGQISEEKYFLYYVDLQAKQHYALDKLFGQHIEGCCLIDDTLTCWTYSDNRYTAWNWNPSTAEKKMLFENKPDAFAPQNNGAGLVFLMGFDSVNHWDEMYIGSRFALETDENNAVSVIDLKNGLNHPLKDFRWSNHPQRIPSPDGKKLVIARGENGMDLEYIGILDFDGRRLTEFSRDHGDLDKHLIYWFDNNSVVLKSSIEADAQAADYFIYHLASE